ncbi:hypothetical protein L1049_000598 [Liquidambar formosana]|uniref:RNase H type-1 domain-containing protein n=1 Tax=Liquidambar formosana TaxID=63359 RepID=A0AAP0ND23_LIQFO
MLISEVEKQIKQGIGVVIRDDRRVWLCGYMGHSGVCIAEPQAILAGVKFEWDERIPRIMLELDSVDAIRCILGTNNEEHSLAAVIQVCKNLMSKKWNYFVGHTLRDQPP